MLHARRNLRLIIGICVPQLPLVPKKQAIAGKITALCTGFSRPCDAFRRRPFYYLSLSKPPLATDFHSWKSFCGGPIGDRSGRNPEPPRSTWIVVGMLLSVWCGKIAGQTPSLTLTISRTRARSIFSPETGCLFTLVIGDNDPLGRALRTGAFPVAPADPETTGTRPSRKLAQICANHRIQNRTCFLAHVVKWLRLLAPLSLHPIQMLTDPSRRQIEALQTRYVRVIDDDRVEEWPKLFTATCLYRIVTRENHAQGLPLSIMECRSRGMMEDRVTGLRRINVYEPQRYTHQIGALEIEPESETRFKCRSNYLVIRTTSDGSMSVFSAGVYLIPWSLRATPHCSRSGSWCRNRAV